MMTGKPIILIGADGFWSVRDLVNKEVFKDRFDLLHSENFNADDHLLERVEAVVVADQFFGEVLMDKFPNLKVIARTGTGYDSIDVAAACRKKIPVTRVAELNSESVSEFALGFVLSLARNIPALSTAMSSNNWQRKQGLLLHEMTVGLVGLGTIGRSLAGKLHALGVKRLLGWNRTPRTKVLNAAMSFQLELTDLATLMSKSNMISVAVALAPETKHLISRELLSKMKPGACLVNASRGAVVDEDALAEFVEGGRIGGVALDVFSEEPPDGELFQKPFFQKLSACARRGANVILTPHNAGFSNNSVRNVSLKVAKNIVGVLDNKLDEVEIVEHDL